MHDTTRGDAIAEELEEIATRLETLMPLINDARRQIEGLSRSVSAGRHGSDPGDVASGGFDRLDLARMRIVDAVHHLNDPLWQRGSEEI